MSCLITFHRKHQSTLQDGWNDSINFIFAEIRKKIVEPIQQSFRRDNFNYDFK
jgi:hypothetical protein